MGLNITYELSKRTSNFEIKDLSNEQLKDLKYKILDWFGCAIGGVSKESGKKIINSFRGQGDKNASVIGLKDKIYYPYAAYANGMIGHILELDDVHKSSISHPGATAIPPALAVAEAFNSKTEDFLMGVVAGYETIIRLGEILNPSHYETWHTTGTCGAFASAAASARVRRFDVDDTNTVLNMVSTMASGLTSVFGTDTKLATVGNACHSGLMSSILVENGLSATIDVFAITNGYAEATSRENKFDLILKDTDKFMIDTAAYKIHASCGHTHSAIDGLMSILQEEDIDKDQISRVEVRTYDKAVELTGDFNKESEQKAKFSLPYCIACVLGFGKVTLNEFTDDILNSDIIMSLANKVQVYNDEEANELYPNIRMAKVKVYVGDRTYERTIDLPFGKPGGKFIKDKFMSLATMSISERNAEKVIDYIMNINQMKDMNEFTEVYKYIN